MINLSGLFKVIYFFKYFFFLSDIRESVRFWFNLTFLWNYRYWHYLSRGSFTISVWCKICQMSYVLLATNTALHCMGRIGKIGLHVSILQKDKILPRRDNSVMINHDENSNQYFNSWILKNWETCTGKVIKWDKLDNLLKG